MSSNDRSRLSTAQDLRAVGFDPLLNGRSHCSDPTCHGFVSTRDHELRHRSSGDVERTEFDLHRSDQRWVRERNFREINACVFLLGLERSNWSVKNIDRIWKFSEPTVHNWRIKHSMPLVSVLVYERFSSSSVTIWPVWISPSSKFVPRHSLGRRHSSVWRTLLFSANCVRRNWQQFLLNAFNWSSAENIVFLVWQHWNSVNVICWMIVAFNLLFKRKTFVRSLLLGELMSIV